MNTTKGMSIFYIDLDQNRWALCNITSVITVTVPGFKNIRFKEIKPCPSWQCIKNYNRVLVLLASFVVSKLSIKLNYDNLY